MKPKYKISIKDIKLLVGEDLSESSEIDWNDDEILPLFTKKKDLKSANPYLRYGSSCAIYLNSTMIDSSLRKLVVMYLI